MEIKQALEVADSVVVEFVNTQEQEALMTLAAAYRRLTTLRPMADAPVGDFAYYRNPHTKKLYAGFKTQSGKIRTANGGTYVPTVFDGWLPNPELVADLLFSIDGDSKTP